MAEDLLEASDPRQARRSAAAAAAAAAGVPPPPSYASLGAPPSYASVMGTPAAGFPTPGLRARTASPSMAGAATPPAVATLEMASQARAEGGGYGSRFLSESMAAAYRAGRGVLREVAAMAAPPPAVPPAAAAAEKLGGEDAAVEGLRAALEAWPVSGGEVRRAVARCRGGLAGELRARAWRVLLGLGPRLGEDGGAGTAAGTWEGRWNAALAPWRKTYAEFVAEMCPEPNGADVQGEGEAGVDDAGEGYVPFDPLGGSSGSGRERAGPGRAPSDADAVRALRATIDLDVARTHASHPWFSAETEHGQRSRAALSRVLLVYARLNPGVGYTQGMNEVLAPVYYVFASGRGPLAEHAEADAFHCFVDLMGEFRDGFCETMDGASTGASGVLRRLGQLIEGSDRELWEHLDGANKVDMHYYAFRWTTLLLTQEFAFHHVLRIWDSLLSDPQGRQDALLRICAAMVLEKRAELLDGDFSANLSLLQRGYNAADPHLGGSAACLRDADLSRILSRAESLRTRPEGVL